MSIWTASVRGLVERAGFDMTRRQPGVPPRRNTQRVALEQLAQSGLDPSTVIDVGTASGTPSIYLFPRSQYLLIEPLEEFRDALEALVSRLPRAEALIVAVGPTSGMVTLNVHPDLVGSSVLKEDEDSDVNGTPRVVEQRTLDEIVEERSLTGPFLVKVDAQGYELKVLEGAQQKVLPSCEAVLLEVLLYRFFEGGAVFVDVIARMSAWGFAPYDVVEPLYRPLDGALSQVDILFVRENGPFRREHHFATAEQRRRQTDRLKAQR